MPFEFTNVEMPGPVVVRPRVFDDSRGCFLELYKRTDFVKAGIREHLVQDNYSKSFKGVLRGLHYQKAPRAQGKLVLCLKGAIYDVAVDIRKDSPHFGKWIARELTEQNRLMLYVPAGFAHGFQVMSDTADVLYKCTDEYSPSEDRGIIWDDPDVAVSWPLTKPVLSDKDGALPRLRDAEINFTVTDLP